MKNRTPCIVTVTLPFTTHDPRAALAHFRPLAESIAEDDAPPFRGDVNVARCNITRGLAALEPFRDSLAGRVGAIDVARLWELPALCLATTLAVDLVANPVSAGEIAATDRELIPLRESALLYLECVELLGIVPAGRAAAIREGAGLLDRGRDCVALSQTFAEHDAALKGRHPFTAAQLDTLSEKGAWLVANVTPRGVARVRARTEEGLLRDRLGRLLSDRYDEARAVGAVAFGLRDLDAKVPPLFSRVNAPREEAEEEADAKTDAKADAKADTKPTPKDEPPAVEKSIATD